MLPKALVLTVLAGLLAAGSAFAQYYDPALKSLAIGSDVPRSPRLLGMGGLSLSVPDRYQHLSLWDFARSPVGAYDEDTTSTMELRPGSGSASGAHDNATHAEREDLAGRASGMDYELFHRDSEGSAWGAVGTVRSIRTDHVFNATTETRETVSDPEVVPILTGPFPYWGKGKLHYAARMTFAREEMQDEYRGLVSNAAGDFLSLDGRTLDAPGLFDPLKATVRRTGLGLAASYPAGKHATVALGYDVLSDRIAGSNDGSRSVSQVNEKRPYGIAQATLVGTLGKSIEYGFDERHWSSSSQQNWFFSISAGVGAVPLLGRGKLLERKETGNAFNSRVNWTSGNVRVSGQYWTLQSRADFTPPGAGDKTSFNLFLSQIYYRTGADTLSLPDSVISNRDQSNAFGYAGGVSWKLKRGVAGLEYHWGRDIQSSTIAGSGPKAISSDVRAGLEYKCSAIVAGRVGAGLQWQDPDDYVRDDEWKGESASLGLGLTPPAASYSLDLGWTMTWLQTDFPDPLRHRGSHQQLQALLHWTF
jgi:hypothetical protein